MSTILNRASCSTSYGNVGRKDCSKDTFNYIVGFILAFESQKFDAADLATQDLFKTALRDATIEDLPQRIFYLPQVIDFTDSTEAVAKVTSGYGNITQYVEKQHTFDAETEDHGIALWKEIRKFNGNTILRCYAITDTGLLLGYANASGDFMGNKASVHVNQVKVGKKGESTKRTLTIQFQDEGCFSDEQLASVRLDGFNFDEELKGVNNVVLTGTGGVLKISIAVASQRNPDVNLATDYESELEVAGMWSVIDASTGAAVVPSAVAYNSATGKFDLTVTAGSRTATLVSPKLLAAGDVGSAVDGGYEAVNSVTATVTAV